MDKTVFIPPRGVGFDIPDPIAITPEFSEPLPASIEPELQTRLLKHPGHFEEIINRLHGDHPTANTFGQLALQRRYLQVRLHRLQKCAPSTLAAALGTGLAGTGLIGDALLSGLVGHAPFALLAGCGMAAGVWNWINTTTLLRKQN